jgi:hypothetical protein
MIFDCSRIDLERRAWLDGLRPTTGGCAVMRWAA